jgi:NhaA family Na+:H+ antiporter
VPLFALANAGVRLDTAVLDERVLAGVALGLVVGKTVGVLGGAWLAVRLGVGRLPTSATWRHMVGLAVTAGIGLSFTDPALTSSAKVGILLASTVAGILGFALLRTLPAVPVAATDAPVPAGASARLRSDPVGQSSGASSR